MISIRLQRQGKANDPFYRVVSTAKEKSNSGKFLAILGYWYPARKKVTLDKKAVEMWVKKGARVSSAVKKLL